MRLINTSTLKLEDFLEIPEFVTLSHTWGKNEISLQQFQAGQLNAKIRDCCKQAQQDGYQYAWIDTCCIDKTSSAELSEAINSMYRWYQSSAACYVLLEDYPAFAVTGKWFERTDADVEALSHNLRPCKWFTRGWTLQELIAPAYVKFYDAGWHFLGTKMELQQPLSTITKIPVAVLAALKAPEEYNVAVRMSWASKRRTTRVEDRAYCLLGLFDINMPMLYGEGQKAFQRLQEEILKRHDDYSLLAWMPRLSYNHSLFLAADPADFNEERLTGVRFDQLVSLTDKEAGLFPHDSRQSLPSMGSRGLFIRLPMYTKPDGESWLAICSVKGSKRRAFCLAIARTEDNAQQLLRLYIKPAYHVIPHEQEFQEFRYSSVSREKLSEFAYTDVVLQVSASWQPRQTTKLRLKLVKPSEEALRSVSLRLLKASTHHNSIEDISTTHTYESPDAVIILFEYPQNRTGPIKAGLVVGMRNGAPWCSILRPVFQADFYSNDIGFRKRLLRLAEDSVDRAGRSGVTRDVCRIKLGTQRPSVYLAARASKLSRDRSPVLLLDISLHRPGAEQSHEEIGVVDCDLELYRQTGIIKDPEFGVSYELVEEEPVHWRSNQLAIRVNDPVLPPRHQPQPPAPAESNGDYTYERRHSTRERSRER